MAVSRFCKSCGLEFTAAGPGTVGRAPAYCSPACRTAAQRKRNAAYYAANSTAEQTRGRAAYAMRTPKGVCSECGKPVQVGPTSAPPERRRCRDCQRANPKDRQIDPRVCDLCECEYVPKPMHRPGQRWCSKSCAQAWRNGARPPYVKGAAARATRSSIHARTRRLRHAQTWDGITDEEILERDGWRCQIPGCKRRPIRRDVKYPHLRSKSIDHIVPLSLGGDDTAENKRAAHLGCNMARGNKASLEQVALFGSIGEPPLATVTVGELPS